MIKGSKICGISDLDTLNFIINHLYPPQFIGFICNYKKSSRYVDIEKLNKLLAIDNLKSNFVAVLVKPDEDILEKIKHLPFNYYQIYDCTPDEIKSIKEKYNKKIITVLTIRDENDVQKYHLYSFRNLYYQINKYQLHQRMHGVFEHLFHHIWLRQ